MSMTEVVEVVEVVDVEVDGVEVVGEVEDGVMEGVVDGVVFDSAVRLINLEVLLYYHSGLDCGESSLVVLTLVCD